VFILDPSQGLNHPVESLRAAMSRSSRHFASLLPRVNMKMRVEFFEVARQHDPYFQVYHPNAALDPFFSE
jgi:hypothetical protein